MTMQKIVKIFFWNFFAGHSSKKFWFLNVFLKNIQKTFFAAPSVVMALVKKIFQTFVQVPLTKSKIFTSWEIEHLWHYPFVSTQFSPTKTTTTLQINYMRILKQRFLRLQLSLQKI